VATVMMLSMASSEGVPVIALESDDLSARGDLIYYMVDARLASRWATRIDRRISRDVDGDRGARAARMTFTPPCGIYHHFS
jgi:hypothetical protein